MNRLASETSLYLRQHQNNPVDWYPWGDEAIERAKQLDRPIFLSIGYSACHWCHVMEHESFENEAIARYLNEHFVSIKVDREERPDIDHLYMTALQAMTREGGGWPLSVFLTPDLRPFYAGTYYPPDDRFGTQRPSFPRLLAGIVSAWQTQRQDIVEQGEAVAEFLRSPGDEEPHKGFPLGAEVLVKAGEALLRSFDATYGGFGGAPKFPHALELRLLLRIARRTGRAELLHAVRFSLDQMAMGGIYDQIGGGFHRYSTDARWLVPHFEKMLYDNALLVPAYVDAWQLTGAPEYMRVARETLDYVLKEMTSPPGAFYSTQDADSEGEEGKFYVWSSNEIDHLLGAESRLFKEAYGVTDGGNFEGRNILHRRQSFKQLAERLGVGEDELRRRLTASAVLLYEARSKRVWPGRDEKILTSWNGLMISALARAGSAFCEERYVNAAVRAADFVLESLCGRDNNLFRTCAVGSAPRIAGYLEDYACLCNALIDLYEATFATRYLAEGSLLAERMIANFQDPAGGFFTTHGDHQHLIARSKDRYDGSTPSGNSMAAASLLRLGRYTGRRDFLDSATKTLGSASKSLAESPAGSAQMLSALDFELGPVAEIVILCPTKDAETHRVVNELRRLYFPNAIAVLASRDAGMPDPTLIPLLDGKKFQDTLIAYLCQDGMCLAPIVGADAAIDALRKLNRDQHLN